MTYLWINKDAEFLIVSEQTTHTGHHVKAFFTKDVNQAFVGVMLPKFNDGTKADALIAVPAWVERKVFVGHKKQVDQQIKEGITND